MMRAQETMLLEGPLALARVQSPDDIQACTEPMCGEFNEATSFGLRDHVGLRTLPGKSGWPKCSAQPSGLYGAAGFARYPVSSGYAMCRASAGSAG